MWASKQSAQQSLQNFSIDLELPGSGIPDPVVSAMLDYAAAHYQEKVALQDIANALNYSIAFLNKRFKSRPERPLSNISTVTASKKRWI